MKRAFKYRLYPTKEQIAKLQWTLEQCRKLYNTALAERKDAYNFHVKQHPNYYDEETRKQLTQELTINYHSQQNQLPEIRQLREEYQEISSSVLQNVCRRVNLAMNAFFRRVREHAEEPGYPRFKGKNRYDSITYGGIAGIKVKDRHIRLPKFEDIRVKFHTPLEGTLKTVTVKREGEHWYIILVCEVDAPEKLPVSYEDVGIDLGVTHLAALSNGEIIDHPRYLRKAAKKLEKLQRAKDRKKHGSHRRKKAAKQLAKAHRKVARQRRDFLHNVSHKLVNRYQVIVFEDLETANLTKRPKPKQDENGKHLPNNASAKAGLNKSILDAGWYMFVEMCRYKAEEAGRTLLQVNPKYTSQTCSGCGAIKKKELSERWHSCECGTELDRDVNAAINILRAGVQPAPVKRVLC